LSRRELSAQAAWWTGGWAENPAHLPRALDMRMRNQRTTGNGLHLETLFLFYIKTITLLFFNVIAAFTSSAHRRWSTLQTQTNGRDDTEGMMTSHKHQKVPSHFFQSGPTHLRHPSPPRARPWCDSRHDVILVPLSVKPTSVGRTLSDVTDF